MWARARAIESELAALGSQHERRPQFGQRELTLMRRALRTVALDDNGCGSRANAGSQRPAPRMPAALFP